MKVALIGATGWAGSAIRDEALSRGHSVTGISRHPEQLPPHPRLTPASGDVFNAAQVAALVRGHDAVISAYGAGRWSWDPKQFDDFVNAMNGLIAGLRAAKVKRVLVVGGASSLEVRPGVQYINASLLPREHAHLASGILGARQAYYILKTADDLEWTVLAPSLQFAEEPARGNYRLGLNEALYDETGRSWISLPDYAKAMIEELEHPRHIRQRFTVGY